MKKALFYICYLSLFSIISCGGKDFDNEPAEMENEQEVDILRLLFPSKKDKFNRGFYYAVYRRDYPLVESFLERGPNPDFCRGKAGWVDSNPLNVVARSFYYTYYTLRLDETIPNPPPDIATFNVLVKAGADINERPYIWERVSMWDNKSLESEKEQRELNNESVDENDADFRYHMQSFIADVNRVLEVFLEAGADPDKLSHPYPFGYEAVQKRITDKEAKEYFLNGTRAINEAIKKGVFWESQVDLLLKYTELDENSLKAAEESNDQAMIDKINVLWNEQIAKGGH
ncbi:MAG: hypothetical protein LBJ31_07010 [Treponema sp.]|jgi:hypothetical protein|nr:hypothetical protein [Treponema sp.]